MVDNGLISLGLGGAASWLWNLRTADGRIFGVEPPVIEIEGRTVRASVMGWGAPKSVVLPHGVTETRARGVLADDLGVSLELVVRSAPDSPILRFQYRLHADAPRRLTRSAGRDRLEYLWVSFADLPLAKEVQVAQWNEQGHSYGLAETELDARHFDAEWSVMGPILIGADESHSLLLAYEHGSQPPNAFLEFGLLPNRAVVLRAVKGNLHDGQTVGPEAPFETLWFQIGALAGDEDALAAAYREFVLRWQSPNPESRKPYIFYNTWNHQERIKAWDKKPYLGEMTLERMLAEIDAAHAMGIEVFVIDTGWYEKTGDWRVSQARFPDGLQSIKAKLDGYGMKLGLWFDPLNAALSSRMRRNHEDCLMTWDGQPRDPHAIWETEESQPLCLVSRYGEAFADELIRLVREVGVTYFKWDAIGQYGCNDPGHGHGTAENTPEERAERYAFELPRAMARVIDKLCAACPEAIVDFDVTESGRAVGLGFLAAGKYFLINNGPYSSNYDMPVPADGNVNLFFFPGPARTWICRAPLTYDRWLPSVLFLTHYLPDDRYRKHGWGTHEVVTTDANQWLALASLVLGQNGIWGDLVRVTPEGRARFGDALARYKAVREDVTRATLRRTGAVGGSPEVYEKIDGNTGRGVVSVFAVTPGTYHYVTEAAVDAAIWHNAGVTVTRDEAGRARITARFETPTAKLIVFGA